MSRALVGALVVIVVAGLGLAAAQEPIKIGAGVTIQKATPIAQVIKDPEKFHGKSLRVEGVVVRVCKKDGCFMDLEDPVTKAKVRCHVPDGGPLSFPASAVGRKAVAQGSTDEPDDHGHDGAAGGAAHTHPAPKPAAPKAEVPKPADGEAIPMLFHVTGALIY